MHCQSCSIAEVGPNTKNQGAFVCRDGHILCSPCNTKNKNKCSICSSKTEFVAMYIPNLPQNAFPYPQFFAEQTQLSVQNTPPVETIQHPQYPMVFSVMPPALRRVHSNIIQPIPFFNDRATNTSNTAELTREQEDNKRDEKSVSEQNVPNISLTVQNAIVEKCKKYAELKIKTPKKLENLEKPKVAPKPLHSNLERRHPVVGDYIENLASFCALVNERKASRDAEKLDEQQSVKFIHKNVKKWGDTSMSDTDLLNIIKNSKITLDPNFASKPLPVIPNDSEYSPIRKYNRCYQCGNFNSNHSCYYCYMRKQELYKVKSDSLEVKNSIPLKKQCTPIPESISFQQEPVASQLINEVPYEMIPTQSKQHATLQKEKPSPLDSRTLKLLDTIRERDAPPLQPTKSDELLGMVNSVLHIPFDIQRPIRDERRRTCVNSNSIKEILFSIHRARLIDIPKQLVYPIEPFQQSEIINCPDQMITQQMITEAIRKSCMPQHASKANILRWPVRCPEISCNSLRFVSDFTNHLILDHHYLPIDRILPNQHKNFLINLHLLHEDFGTLHRLFLLRNKIKNLGSGEFKDYLPMVVMSARINATKLFEKDSYLGYGGLDNEQTFVLIWLTGIMPEDSHIFVTMTVGIQNKAPPLLQFTNTTEVYSLLNSQNPSEVHEANGHHILMTEAEFKILSDNGKNMVEVQVIVH